MIASTQTNAPLSGEGKKEPAAPSQVALATARLKSAGLRITQPRLAILAAMSRHESPASIEQIHAEVGTAACDLVTVYRCMTAFEKIGLVTRTYYHNGTALFTVALGRPDRFHVVCKATNQVEELDPETSADLRQVIATVQRRLRARGYSDVGQIVEFFGIAPAHASRATSVMPVVD